jgi:Flp pilus assembly protein TadB
LQRLRQYFIRRVGAASSEQRPRHVGPQAEASLVESHETAGQRSGQRSDISQTTILPIGIDMIEFFLSGDGLYSPDCALFSFFAATTKIRILLRSSRSRRQTSSFNARLAIKCCYLLLRERQHARAWITKFCTA